MNSYEGRPSHLPNFLNTQTLTHIRILATILVGILTAMLYSGFGKDSSKLISNMNLLFFVQVIVVFTAMMATVLTCKFLKSNSSIFTSNKMLFSSPRDAHSGQRTPQQLVHIKGVLFSQMGRRFTHGGRCN